MTFLIDTQILIWFQLGSPQLKPYIYDILVNPDHKILVSQVSLFEIAIKRKIGKLPELEVDMRVLVQLIEEDMFDILRLNNTHLFAYEQVPLHIAHKDPFDRLIIATAIAENISIISADANFKLYVPQLHLIEA
jgi:PIN domain nuclease of toxin-antitoxin system